MLNLKEGNKKEVNWYRIDETNENGKKYIDFNPTISASMLMWMRQKLSNWI